MDIVISLRKKKMAREHSLDASLFELQQLEADAAQSTTDAAIVWPTAAGSTRATTTVAVHS